MEHSSPVVPPLEGLRAVLEAARAGSFTLAADALGLTHGAVSRRVAAVEAWLGAAVFERHGRGVRLTPAGHRFTREIEQALEAIEQTSERWRPRRRPATVRLSVLPSFAKLWLLPRLAGIQRATPGVRVELELGHRPLDLEAGEADLVVRYGRGDWPGLHLQRLFGETLVPVGSPELVAQLGGAGSGQDLLRLPLIHDSDTSQWRRWLAEEGLGYRPRADDRRFEDYDLVLAAAAGSLGLALLRLPLGQEWLDDGRLAPASPRAQHNPLAHFVGYRREEKRAAVLDVARSLCAA